MQLDVKIDGTAQMDELELLGSRYLRPEQVVLGPVQTFRAQSAATWRDVFIHRVSTTEESLEQANLLKLLTTALVRSAEAKRLVLDFGEERDFWNVVTEGEPQCEHLREWLQTEVDASHKGAGMLTAEQAAAMGEFARLFARGVPPELTAPRRVSLPVMAAAPAEDLEVSEAETAEAEPVEAAVESPVEPAAEHTPEPHAEAAEVAETIEVSHQSPPPPPSQTPAIPVVEVLKPTPLMFPARQMDVVDVQPEKEVPVFASSMPKPPRNTKLVTFFIILGVLAVALILVIVFLSMHS